MFILSLFITMPALAIPPLPSSFWGTVKVNNANVPDGTLVQALIAGQLYAEGFTQVHQGESFFTLDVLGDDTGTTVLDGGREGDAIQFKIGGISADQTAVWHGGTNLRLDLTAASSEPLIAPPAIPTAVPTQTAMLMQVAPTPTMGPLHAAASTLEPQSSSDVEQSSSDAAGQPRPSNNHHTAEEQLSLTDASLLDNVEDGSGGISSVVVVVIALPIVTAMGYTFLALRKKKL
jgi:hypothetical protein